MAMGHRFGKPLVLAAGVVTAILTLGMAAQAGQASFRYSTAQVQRGEITAVVYVAGAVQPVATVPVGATVAGTVARVEVILLTRVRSGDVLAQMDPVPLEARVNAARQALAEAESRCKTLEARLVALQAAVESGQTNLDACKLLRTNRSRARRGRRTCCSREFCPRINTTSSRPTCRPPRRNSATGKSSFAKRRSSSIRGANGWRNLGHAPAMPAKRWSKPRATFAPPSFARPSTGSSWRVISVQARR